jgi:hypothetical protein
MLFASWIRNLKNRLQAHRTLCSRPPSRNQRNRTLLSLELLETRALPSAYVVTTTADSGPGSLRDAINQINADINHTRYTSPSKPNVDEIDFNITAASDTGGAFNAATGVATITLGSALPALGNSVTIQGPGEAKLLISGAGQYQVFDIPPVYGANPPLIAVSLADLTIENGYSSIGGGAIASFDTLAVSNCNFLNNSAYQGGAIWEYANVATVSGCNFSRNMSLEDGGAILDDGTMSVTNSTFSNNSTSVLGSSGGAIFNEAGLTLTDSMLSNNTAVGGGGAVANENTANLTVTDCTLSSNNADYGGALENIDSAVTVYGCTLANNTTTPGGAGAGIYTYGTYNHLNALTVSDSTIFNNTTTAQPILNSTPSGGEGGGICTNGSCAFSISNTTISGNNSAYLGGGIFTTTGVTLVDTIIAGNTGTSQSPDVFGPVTSYGYNLVGDSNGSSGWLSTDLVGGNGSPTIDPKLSALASNNGPTETMAPEPGSLALGHGGAITTLAAAVGAGDTSISLANALIILSTFDPGQYEILIDSEVILVTARDFTSSDVVYVERGWGGTTPSPHSANTPVFLAVDQRGEARTPNNGNVDIGAYQSNPLNSAVVQQSLALSPTHQFIIQANNNTDAQNAVTAVNGLSSQPSPATVTVNLAGGSYADISAAPPVRATLAINGNGSATVIQGHSPALSVSSGAVAVSGVVLTTSTNDPTVLVTGGSLTLRDSTVDQTASQHMAAVSITGGTADLGTANDPGNNVFEVQGQGGFIANATSNSVLTVGDTLNVLGPRLTVNELTVSGSNGAVVSNSGTFSDSTAGATVTALTASAGTVVQNGDGTWSWSETTPTGAVQTVAVTIFAADSNGQTAATEFWLNVGQVFEVTNTGDNGSVNPAPGAGTGTLRQAIVDANNASIAGGPSLIAFAIPASDPGYNSTTGTFTIAPLAALSKINNSVVIDGYTQAGASPNTLAVGDNAVLKIDLSGALASLPTVSLDGLTGLTLVASNSTLEGLAVNGFHSTAVTLEGSADTVAGSFIGTDITGTQAIGNGQYGSGVSLGSSDTVGGSTPAARNIISGNGYGDVGIAVGANDLIEGNYIGTDISGEYALGNTDGVFLTGGAINNQIIGNVIAASTDRAGVGLEGYIGQGSPITGNVIQGNLIGTDATGTHSTDPNGHSLGNPIGVEVNIGSSSGMAANVIGGTAPGQGNLISGNNGPGIAITNSIGNLAEGNSIVGNSGDGVYLDYSAIDNTVGGTAAGAGNSIAANGGDGVDIGSGIGDGSEPYGNAILGNSIQDNAGLGISLANGANDNQAAPALLSASASAGKTSVTGSFASVASATFRIEFFSDASPDSYGYGQGQTFLGFATVATDASGFLASSPDGSAVITNPDTVGATFTVSGLAPLPGGQVYLSATATNLTTGDTSEFGRDFNTTTNTPLPPYPIIVTNSNDSGPGSFRQALGVANLLADVQIPDTIVVKIPTTDPGYQSSTNTVAIALDSPLPSSSPVVSIDLSQEAAHVQTAFFVTSTASTGPGSLDQSIGNADGSAEYFGPNVIDFDIPWNDPGHVYYRGQVNLADVAPVPANSASDADLANAAVVGSGNTIAAAWPHSWWTIELPNPEGLGNNVILNGYSQPGSSPNTAATRDNAVLRIDINGSQQPVSWLDPYFYGNTGFGIGNNSTVTGIVFNGFDTSDPTTGYPSGTNGAHGVNAVFNAAGAQDDVFAGNYFGTDVSGTLAVPNWMAIFLYQGAQNNRIGAGSPQDYAGRNLISGNSFAGIGLFGAGVTENNLIAGNLIGTDRYGNPLGNGAMGVFIAWGAEHNQIGGSGALGNVIAYNGGNAQFWGSEVGGPGVLVAGANATQYQYGRLVGPDPSAGNSIESNSIYGNAGLGIDLASSFFDSTGAITGTVVSIVNTSTWLSEAANDSQGHSGPNNWQDYPVLASAVSSSTSMVVTGTLTEAAEQNQSLTLDFYANSTEDPSGFGQGQIYLGSRTVVTDANGNASFIADLATGGNDANGNPLGSLAGYWISATATHASGDTSEFAKDIQATSALSQTFTQNLPGALPNSTAYPNSLTIEANTNSINEVVSGLGLTNLPASAPAVSVYLNLAAGTYAPMTVQVPSWMTLSTNGVQGTQIDPSSPAFTLLGGNVVISNITFVTTGNAPTILVAGGNLTLHNDVVTQSSAAGTEPAISVTGGTVNLGTATNPGNNTLSVNSSGDLVSNTTGNPISAVGDTFVVGGTPETAPSLSFTSLVASAASTIPDQPVTLMATVAPDLPGSATPTGSIDFYDTTTSTDLGKVTLSGGVADLSTSALALGTHVVRASYGGDSNYLPSVASLMQAVTESDYILNGTASGALNLSGNSSINLPGTIVVDSNSKTALTASGNASIKAAGIQVVGGVSKSGKASLKPAPITGTSYVPDPLATLAVPFASNLGLSKQGSVDLSGNSSKTISPGIYSQITVSGNASLTLKPGNYILAGGGLTVSGSGSIGGNGVMLFNAGSGYNPTTGSDGGTYGSITLSSNGTDALAAPTTGTYAGILIFQDRGDTRALALSGNATIGTSGTIYAPKAAVTLSGNAQGGSSQLPALSFVVDTMTLSDNSIANALETPPNGIVAYSPAQVRTAYGINALPLDGTGQTIAIVDAYDNPAIFQSLDAFDQQFATTPGGSSLYQLYGPAAGILTVLNQQGQSTPLPAVDPSGPGVSNWEAEAALDVEWAHAIAPGAQIMLVEANSQALADLMTAVATAAQQPGVSVVSMSWGFAEGQAVFAADEAAYDSYFTTPGVTFVASTGDDGAADPEYPAFSSNVVAVGGTSLSLNADNSYNSETGWGYTDGALGTFTGSGGGLSGHEPEPAYQQGVQSTGARTTPDVSLVADPATGAWIADPYNLLGDTPFEVVGGTSLAAPSWAGLIALANQGRAAAGDAPLNSTTPTDADQALYDLPQSDYNVITDGNNGFSAGAGYNLVTGLGTPVANRLVPDLVAYQGAVDSGGQGPTFGPIQSASLVYNGTGSGSNNGPANAFNVFDFEPSGNQAFGISPVSVGSAGSSWDVVSSLSTGTIRPTARPASVNIPDLDTSRLLPPDTRPSDSQVAGLDAVMAEWASADDFRLPMSDPANDWKARTILPASGTEHLVGPSTGQVFASAAGLEEFFPDTGDKLTDPIPDGGPSWFAI